MRTLPRRSFLTAGGALDVARLCQLFAAGSTVTLAYMDSAIHSVGEPELQFELSSGDAVYIPRGYLHEASATSSVSLHITLGVLAYTWTDLLLECVADACLNDDALRKALPPGFARDAMSERQTREMFDGLLRRLSERVSPQRTLDRFVDEFLASCPPLLRGQMAQLASLEQMGIDTLLAARPHLIVRVQVEPRAVSVRHFGRKITFPLHVASAVRFALSQERFRIRDLPGDLDDAGKLTLARRLVREGLLVTCPASGARE